MSFFDIDHIFFEVWGSPVSYLEFFGTLTGAIAVWLAARANIWSWPIGIISVVLVFFLVFQVQLYPDMFLQVFYFITNVLGWWRWTHPKPGEEDRRNELKVSYLSCKKLVSICVFGLLGSLGAGSLASHLHEWFPKIFSLPSAYPYLDSFVAIMSVITTFLMIQKKIENWIFWIIIDIVATGLYFSKGIRLLSLEYLGFCFIAAYGLVHWIVEYRSYRTNTTPS